MTNLGMNPQRALAALLSAALCVALGAGCLSSSDDGDSGGGDDGASPPAAQGGAGMGTSGGDGAASTASEDASQGTADGDAATGVQRPPSGEGGEGAVAVASFALASSEAEPVANTNSCEGGAWVDHDCDGRYESEIVSCDPEAGFHISHVEGDPCPVCVEDEPDRDTSSCETWSAAYREFMVHNVSQSCANWCEQDSDCFAWQIDNACGSVVIPLFGGIDEEPLLFAAAFAAHNCGGCEQVEPSEIGKRSDNTYLTGEGSELLDAWTPACDLDARVCVLRRAQ